jgi:hypothetical protein
LAWKLHIEIIKNKKGENMKDMKYVHYNIVFKDGTTYSDHDYMPIDMSIKDIQHHYENTMDMDIIDYISVWEEIPE